MKAPSLICGVFALVSIVACTKSQFRAEQEKSPEKPATNDLPVQPDDSKPPVESPVINDNQQSSNTNANINQSQVTESLGKIAEEIIGLTGKGPNNVPGNGGETPLVLDWDRDGSVSLLNGDVVNSILFDIDGDGALDFLEWVSPAEAFLVHDLNHDGRIESGAELFGSATALRNQPGVRPSNGFIALAQFDQNQDSRIDKQDAIFAELDLWIDRNHNGSSDAGELQKLSQTDVSSISVAYQNVVGKDRTIAAGRLSQIGQVAEYRTKDGTSHKIFDVYFHVTESGHRTSYSMLRFDGVK